MKTLLLILVPKVLDRFHSCFSSLLSTQFPWITSHSFRTSWWSGKIVGSTLYSQFTLRSNLSSHSQEKYGLFLWSFSMYIHKPMAWTNRIFSMNGKRKFKWSIDQLYVRSTSQRSELHPATSHRPSIKTTCTRVSYRGVEALEYSSPNRVPPPSQKKYF